MIKPKLKCIVVVTLSRFCCHCQLACYETSLKNVLTFVRPLLLQDETARNVSDVICVSDIWAGLPWLQAYPAVIWLFVMIHADIESFFALNWLQ